MALEVCVKGLPPRVDEDTVRDFFSRVGQVEAVSVNSDTANVVFANEEDMQEALRLNGMPFEDGAPISVSRGGAGVGEERDVPAAEGSRADNTSRNKANRDEFKVAVRKLPPNITEEDLRNLFSPCGTIADFHLHRTKEYAFVGFENKEACDAALMLNDHEINGQSVQVEMKLTRTSRTEGRVVVKNLPADATEDSIRTFFSNCGNITDVFHNSKKQFAFLAFDRPDAAQRAIDRTGEDIGGSTIKVEQRDAQQKCFKCNQMGHIAAQCRSSAILCRECGKPGHVARDCRSVRGRGAGFGGGGFRRNDRGDRDDRRRPRSRSRSASVDRDRRRRRRSSSPRRRHSRSPRRHSRHHSRSPSRSRRY